MRLARTPIPPPAPAEQQPEAPSHIIVRHPHYDSSHNVLLRLLAVDTQGGAGGHGLCAQFVLDACAVVAGNRWDGWLSETADATAAAVDASSILAKPSYYFHLAGERPYAIVPSFREWRFPHGDLPIHWTTAIPADDRPTHRSCTCSATVCSLSSVSGYTYTFSPPCP
ncbi:hypothetical protein BU26DRAFT_172035 [Trematosphaeria pertusa]|uniref:Uncharacterized protein n=1 Tax=Trematosphaeria pertusa TaxID=390896 RepID=A0A6A6HV32_9PLEO|nr:uncharacterized protein BU26DRAFT_172035 [Trematosphaeria pertusa]KAF2241887.1 hypothetical protein BU26DRAFT_172035 [Trematosphaeria pertusa]